MKSGNVTTSKMKTTINIHITSKMKTTLKTRLISIDSQPKKIVVVVMVNIVVIVVHVVVVEIPVVDPRNIPSKFC